jgi:hypothetical protein
LSTDIQPGRGRAADRNQTPQVHVLYIAGIGRSGSTLLCRTLGAVHGCFATGELMRFLCRGVNNRDLCSCGAPVDRCALWGRVLAELQERCPGLDLERLDHTRKRVTEGWEFLRYLFLPRASSELARDLEDYRSFLSALYCSIRTATSCRVVVDSSKNFMFAKLLTETHDVRVHILHLVRDSRGVAHSLARTREEPGTNGHKKYFRQHGPVLSSILWSAAQLSTEWLAARASYVMRVRYEEFVADPRAVVGGVLRKLSPVIGAAEAAHVNGGSVKLGTDHIIASNPNRSERGEIRLEEDAAWRFEMSPGRRWLVTGLTFPLLRRYGYSVRPIDGVAG